MHFFLVGAGSAGSVLTKRLLDHGFSVLLLEAGGPPDGVAGLLSRIPIAAAALQLTGLNWGYKTVTQRHCCGALKDKVLPHSKATYSL